MNNMAHAVLRLLEKNKIDYTLAEHPAVFNMEELYAQGLEHCDAIAKNLLVRDQKKRFYWLLVLYGEKRADLKALKARLGHGALSFAGAEELAELLGVGRNSVREALRTLSLMGFISSTQGAGNFVSCDIEKNLAESTQMMMLLGATDYRQVSELRQGLESQTVLLAAERVSPAQLSELEDIVWQLRDENDLEKSAALDKRLHYLIGEAAGNQLIMVILRAMSETVDSFISHMREKMMLDEGYRKRLQDTHQGIVLALQDRNGVEAARMMREHFRVVDSAMVDLF